MSNIEDFLEQISYFPIDVRRNMNLIKELSLLEDKSIKQLEKAQTDIKMLLGLSQSAERDFLVNSHKQTIQRLHLQLLALHRERINCAEYISYHLNIYQKQLDIELDNYVEELKKLPPEQEEVMVRKSTRDFIKLEPPKPANAKRKNKLEFEPQIDDTNNKPYCECQRPSFGPMVACDNPHCKFEWFHLECLNLKEIPPEDQGWFCPRCAAQRFQ